MRKASYDGVGTGWQRIGHRMLRVLSTRSTNGTCTEEERSTIQIDQLTDAIDRPRARPIPTRHAR